MKGLGVNCFSCRALGYDGQVGFTKLESAKLPVKEKECNRKVAPLKQRFLTRCNRMAVSDAVCVI